ncbi:hypothetical protein GCM10010306_074110 [Streptomyces umbrinus]|nr:hypothetical protein GCM10010306_074110 [Streptomyces umbrinus]
MAPTREWDIPHGFEPRILTRTDASIALPDRALITHCRGSLRDLGLGALPRFLRTACCPSAHGQEPKNAAKTPAITALL